MTQQKQTTEYPFMRAKHLPTDSRICEIKMKGSEEIHIAAFIYGDGWFLRSGKLEGVACWRYARPLLRVYRRAGDVIRHCGSHSPVWTDTE